MALEVVKTEAGYVSGTVLGETGKEVYIFRGIPYAAPPLRELRWKPPQPAAPWVGIRECTVFSKQAPHGPQMTKDPIPQEMSEDCLYLNILTPAKKPGEKLPVMVWMHGGGLIEGDGNRALYNGLGLPQHGIVQVNLNMRLGVIGLFAHPLLSKESPNKVSGNYLFLDMIAALKWVQKNIAAFGGDPGNVTIFGQSGGGTKVTGLLCSPLAKNLFHRAIIQSGAGLVGLPLKDIEIIGEKLFALLKLDKEKDPLAAARDLPWEKIIDANLALKQDDSIDKMALMEPVAIDGWFLSDTPLNIFNAGKQNLVPLITGSTLGELSAWPHRLRKHIPYYVDMLAGNNKAGGKGYAYIFDHVPAGWRKEGCITCHAMELPYLFGTSNEQLAWDVIFSVATNDKAGAKSQKPGCTTVDAKVSEMMSTVWASFAKAGDPNVEGMVQWPAHDADTDRYLYISARPEVKSGFSKVA
jgi:para-nitrobenzyl esterase